ncbi:MAG: type IV pilus secretin PilQ [Deltaproteobacteria bacterium]|nr:type IV pilus secretin PilQ [Deltaproteobacteria bacterium]
MTERTRSDRRWLSAMVLGASLLVAGPVLAQDAQTLGGVAVSENGGDVVITISSDARPSCADFTLTDPPTLVVSCVGMTMGSVAPVQEVGNGVVSRIEISESSDADGTNTQLRLLLDDMTEYDKVVSDTSVTITLRTGAGGDADSGDSDAIADAMADDDGSADEADSGFGGSDAPPGTVPANLRLDSTRTGQLSSVDGDHVFGSGTQVRGVDFQNLLADGVSRLIITGSTALDYTTSYPSDSQVVIALHSSTLGSGLERRLDTSKFASAVSSIASFSSRTSRGDVKVVVDLVEGVRPTFKEQGNVLLVDFPIPPSIAGSAYQSDGSVADGGPIGSDSATGADAPEDEVAAEDRIESAIGRERLIGAGGKSVDPAKKARVKQDNLFGAPVFMGEINPSHTWRGFPINLDLVNANIHNVFRLISHVSKLNIVSSDDVKGLVTVRMIEVPWDQALAALLQAKSLGAVQYGNVLRVAPLTTIRQEREEAAAAERAREEAQPLSILALPLNYADSSQVEKNIEGVLSRRGKVNFDARTNTVIVRDIDSNLSQIRELVKSLDTPTPQVLIEARIVEASQNFTRSLGIQWGGNLNFSPATGAPTGLFFPNSIGVSGGETATVVAPGVTTVGGRNTNFTTSPNYVVDLPSPSQSGSLGVSLGSVTGLATLDVRLTAGEATGEGKVISAPSVTTVTNKQASIRDGARIPYETASLRGTNVQFVDATLQLDVTPQITADGTIFLDVSLTKNQPDFGVAIGGLPTIQIKEAKTTVAVDDGDTTVIGGVYSYEESKNVQMLPGLGRIPVLGWLFKNSTKRVDRKELLVFITPTILRSR